MGEVLLPTVQVSMSVMLPPAHAVHASQTGVRRRCRCASEIYKNHCTDCMGRGPLQLSSCPHAERIGAIWVQWAQRSETVYLTIDLQVGMSL